MDDREKTIEQLEQEIDRLRARLAHTEAALQHRDGNHPGEAIRESERRFRALADDTPAIVWATDLQGRAEFINRAYCDFFRVTREQVEREGWQPLVHPDDQQQYVETFMICTRERKPFRFQVRVRRYDGEWRWIDSQAQPRYSDTGEFEGMVGSAVDITEQKEAEEALRESEERFRTMADGTPVLIWVNDELGKVKFINPAYCHYFNVSLEDVQATGWQPLVHPEDQEVYVTEYETCTRERRPFRCQVRVRRSDGHWRWIDSYGQPRFSDTGEFLGMAGSSLDITEHKQAEEILAYHASLLDNIHDAVIATDAELRVTAWNKAAEELYGYSEQEVLGKKASEIIRSEITDFQRDELLKLMTETGRVVVEVKQFTRDGRQLIIEGFTIPRRNIQGDIIGYVSANRDISARKQVEEALRESEERFRTLANHISQLAWMADPNGWIFWYNQRWFDFTGTTLEEMQGWGWTQVHHPEHMDRVVEKYRHCMQDGEVWEDTFPLRGYDGRYRWFLSRAFPIRDEAGQVLRWFGTNTDITQLREVEEAAQSFASQLQRSNQELQDFAYNASHDLQEPLRKIQSFTNAVANSASLSDNERDYLRRAQNAARRMQKMIDDLLELSRVSTRSKPYESVDLNQVVQTILEDLEPRLRETGGQVNIQTLPVIEADGIQMHRLFLNLLSNALKFHRPGATPVVEIGVREQDQELVELYVRDNGIGFDMQDVEKIFQPFKRLHGRTEYEGSGMGLPICLKIAERHSGRIYAESSPGAGATFFIKLPVRQEVASPQLAAG